MLGYLVKARKSLTSAVQRVGLETQKKACFAVWWQWQGLEIQKRRETLLYSVVGGGTWKFGIGVKGPFVVWLEWWCLEEIFTVALWGRGWAWEWLVGAMEYFYGLGSVVQWSALKSLELA